MNSKIRIGKSALRTMASLSILREMGGICAVTENAPLTQAARYTRLGASQDIVRLVDLGNKAFGCAMETITSPMFGCSNVKDTPGKTGYDLEKSGCPIELKSSRLWTMGNNMNWRWKHVLPDHELSYLMCAGVDIDKVRYFIVSKPQFMALISDGFVTQQGGGGGQGCWFSSTDVIGRSHEFQCPDVSGVSLAEQLDKFIAENPSSPVALSREDIDRALEEGEQKKKERKRIIADEKTKEKERKAELKAQEKAKEKARKAELKAAEKAAKQIN